MFTLLLNTTCNKIDIFNKIYEQYKDLVKYIALDIVKNDMHADEVVQETFLRLFLKIDDIEDVYSFKTHGLVIIITRRISYNKLKYERIRRYEPENNIKNICFKSESAEDIAIRKIEQERIFNELSKKNEDDFELLTLRYYYGYSYNELEEFFNSSADTLRKRFQRYKNKIISDYEELLGENNEKTR